MDEIQRFGCGRPKLSMPCQKMYNDVSFGKVENIKVGSNNHQLMWK